MNLSASRATKKKTFLLQARLLFHSSSSSTHLLNCLVHDDVGLGSLDGRCIVKTMLMRSFGLTTRLLVLSCFVSADGGVRACATSALNTFTRDENPQILIFLFIFSLRSQGHVSFLAVSKKERNVSYIFMPVRKFRPILNPPKSVERFR